jgi:hypothetical protein
MPTAAPSATVQASARVVRLWADGDATYARGGARLGERRPAQRRARFSRRSAPPLCGGDGPLSASSLLRMGRCEESESDHRGAAIFARAKRRGRSAITSAAVLRDGGPTRGLACRWHPLARRRAAAAGRSRARRDGSLDRRFSSASSAHRWPHWSTSDRRRLVHALTCRRTTAGRAPPRRRRARRGSVSSRAALHARVVAAWVVC